MDEGENLDERADGPTADPHDATNVKAMGAWDAVIADMEETAAEYEQRDWETLQCHPGDVTIQTDERVGLDVLVPDNEFEQLTALLDGVTFDESEVYKASDGTLVYLLIAMKDATTETAVLFPVYYDPEDATALLERAQEEGELRSYLRCLSGDSVTITHDDPSLFSPPEASVEEQSTG